MDKLGLNQDDLKRRNRSNVLNTILDYGAICRRDIAKLTGLTSATVTNLTSELIACSIVEEIGSDQTEIRPRGGPNPVLLSISSEEPYILGLNLGSKNIAAGLVDLRGKIVAERSIPLISALSPQNLRSEISDLADALCQKQGIDLKRDIIGVGFTTSGNFEEDGTVVWHKNLSMVGLSVKKLLRELFGLPVFVGTTGRAMALAEAWFGAGRPYQNYLFTLVDEAVDGAMVFNRSVLVGKRHFSSLIGHKPVSNSGPLCYCGQRGCLDAVASDDALCVEAEAYALKNRSLLSHMFQGKPITKSGIIESAAHGDEYCRKLLENQGKFLGKAIADIINLIDVEAAIIAMNLDAPESDMAMNAVASAYTKGLNLSHGAPNLFFSQMKRDLFIVGPATLVIRRVFSPELRISSDGQTSLRASLSAD